MERAAESANLTTIVIPLLKGVIYQESDPGLWSNLLNLQARVRDYVAVLGLALVLDESEGYAFLRSNPETADDSLPKLPRLIARRPLSFPVSLLLATRKVSHRSVRNGSPAGNPPPGIPRRTWAGRDLPDRS